MKAFVQKAISFLPWSHRINYLFQRYTTGGVILTDEHFGLKLEHARDHLKYLHNLKDTGEDTAILELGTGWYPVIPLLFYLSASGRVISIDIRKWLTHKSMIATIRKYKDWRARGLLADLEEVIHEDRWEAMMNVLHHPAVPKRESISDILGLTLLVGDARNLALADQSIDFICSNNTFEHIPPEILRGILAEFSRVLKPGGMMSHFIDMSDHFAHFDPSINIYNFLKFSSRKWHFLDNRIQPQNRMRLKDYRDMYSNLGIPVTEEIIRSGDAGVLENVRVHGEFSGYSPEELAVSHAYIISRMI
jgi:SAM-dependent methyltransferase